jgi:LysR family transcriptional activator of mexEF-oprN operon
MKDIIQNDLRRVDLNLLLIFRALMRERSVTRAAQSLFLGQPAVSGALKRLRAAFDDELFVRTPRGLSPTQRALALSCHIEPLLQSLHQVMTQQPAFEPATAQRVFHVGLSDSLEVVLVPDIVVRLTRQAPNVKLVVQRADSTRAAAMLDDGSIELAVGVFRECAPWHRRAPLFQWRFMSAYNPRLIRPRGKRLTLNEFLRHRHVLTSFSAGLHGYVDEQLELRGLHRQVVFSSPNFMTSPFIALRTPVIVTVPEFIAHIWRDTLGLSLSPLPFDVPRYDVSLMWAATNDRDAGLVWLASQFSEAFGV